MGFKKAKYNDDFEDKVIIDESTEEILDYLLRSRSFLSDLTLKILNKKLKKSLTQKLSSLFKNLINFKTNVKSVFLFTFCLICLVLINVKADAFPSKILFSNSVVGLQVVENAEVKAITPLDFKKIRNVENSKNASITVSEEDKDNLSGIKPGSSLMLVPGNLKTHKVKRGEDLLKIARNYGISPRQLVNANFKIDILNLKGRESIIIPDNKKVKRSHRYKLASRGMAPSISFSNFNRFMWPTAGARIISSKFGFRWERKHLGVDLQGKKGDPILAAQSGIIEFSGWDGEYGKCIIINHGSNLKTVYAHASKLSVKIGEIVDAGQSIGAIGTTGRTTGPHLHFEVRQNNVPRDPEKYL